MGVSEISVQVVSGVYWPFRATTNFRMNANNINAIYYIFPMDDFYDFGVYFVFLGSRNRFPGSKAEFEHSDWCASNWFTDYDGQLAYFHDQSMHIVI